MVFKQGNIPWNIGLKHSQKTIEKMKISSPKVRPWSKGKKMSDIARKHMSEGHMGLNNWMKGKKQNKETIEKARKTKLLGYQTGRIKPWNKGLKMSKEYCEKLSKIRRGELNANWKGGLSFQPYNKEWNNNIKQNIRNKYNYKCKICGNYGNTVHHIDYDKYNCNENNLVNLCNKCHSKTNFNRNYWKNYFLISV